MSNIYYETFWEISKWHLAYFCKGLYHRYASKNLPVGRHLLKVSNNDTNCWLRRGDIPIFLVSFKLNTLNITGIVLFWIIRIPRLCLEVYPFKPIAEFYIETNHLICSANQMTGFYMKCNAGVKCAK